MNIVKHIIILCSISLLSWGNSLFAQDPPYNHYDEDNGLPSNEVYGLALSQNNVLWATTDRGIVKFDGYEFTTFTLDAGLQDDCNLRIFTDPYNRIWLTSLINSVNIIDNDKVLTPGFNSNLMKIPAHEQFVQQLFFFEDSSIYINFNNPGLYKISEDSIIQVTDHLIDQQSDKDFCIIYHSDKNYYWDQIAKPKLSSSTKIEFEKINDTYYLKAFSTNRNNHLRKYLIPLGPDEFIFSYIDWIFHFKNGKLIYSHRFKKEIICLAYDSEMNDFWIGFQDNGAWRYKNMELNSNPVHYMAHHSISSILIDHEHNYWFSTTHDGIYQANTTDIENYYPSTISHSGENDDIITALCPTDKGLYFGTRSGKVFFKSLNQIPKLKVFDSQLDLNGYSGSIRKLFYTSEGSLLIFNDYYIEILPDGRIANSKYLKTYPYNVVELPNHHCLISYTYRIFDLYKDKIYRNLSGQKSFEKVKHMLIDTDGTLWLSSQPYGVFQWPVNQSEPSSCTNIDTLFNKRALDIAQTGDLIWFSVTGYGLLAYSKTNQQTFKITRKSHHLSSDIVDVLFTENDSVLWAGSNAGLDMISISKDTTFHFNCMNFTTKLGLPSNRVHDITKFAGSMWIGTNRGLVRLLPGILKPPENKNLNVQIISVKEDSVLYPLSDETYVLDARKHSLEFSFRAVSFQKPHEVYYKYRLLPLQEEWLDTRNKTAHYSGLGQGEYHFEVKASYSPDFTQSTVAVYPFVIKKQFHETLFHMILVIMTGIAMLTFLIIRFIQILKKRERNKQRLLLAEKKALLAQMNPHFIFNSLNSIQHYIIQQDEENANLYLSKFAALIRRILDNSKRKTISLAEEIETLTLYLKLEKLRFEDKFDYKITKSKDLDQHDLVIPPMIIQPFVENAIWHGLTPLKSGGKLEIHFYRKAARMIVIIEDNGIGRTKAAKVKRPPGYISTGLSNINERLSLMNKMSKQPIYCDIIDLTDNTGQASGTRIELSIPI